jgi:glycosyltransferase involved in cell wall biosynthesis
VRILFVNNAKIRGGGEEFLRDLLPGLMQKGVQVDLVCRPGTPLETMFQGMPITIYPIERSGFSRITSVFKIAKIIKDNRYDIISIQRGHDIVQSWIAARLSGTRVLLSHTVHIVDFIRSRFLLGRLDGIVTISRYVYQKLVDFSPELSERLTIIHNGVDLDLFNAAKGRKGFIRDSFHLSADTPLISTVGLMWKNQIAFLDALVEIKSVLPETRYLLLTAMNGSPQIQEFKDRVAALGLEDSVLWLDTLPKGDMPAYYADLDLAVNTFPREGFGLWVVEALAMGTPVVAFDEGGVRDSLEGCPAAVLVKNSTKAMTEAVVRILKDREVRKQMSEPGPQWVKERFSRERMVENYYRYFDSLVQK